MSQTRIISFLFLLFALTVVSQARPRAEKGVLDLREYDFARNGILEIEGEWAFFWQEFTDPYRVSDSGAAYVQVPVPWNKLTEEVPGITSEGYASYHLKILLPEPELRLALRVNEVFSGSGYYVNGRNIGFNGFPGSNRYQTVFRPWTNFFIFESKDTVANLVIHVSSYEHRSGGIRGEVELGTPVQIMEDHSNRLFTDYFLIGAFLIMGIFFLGLYLLRREDYRLYFSVICLLMTFRIAITGNAELFGPDWLNGLGRLRLEYLSFDLLVPFFVLMIRHLFPYEFNRTLFRVILWISAFFIALVVVAPMSLFTRVYPFFMVFVFITAGVIFYVLILAWIRGRTYAPGFSVGIMLVVAGAINDMLFVYDVLYTGYVTQYTMFIFLLIYAFIFAKKSNYLVIESERLATEITEVNENLENLVEKRTHELEQKSFELMKNQEELEQKNKQLESMNQARNKIFTIISHDIRAPIGYIRQMLELLLEGELTKKEFRETLTMLVNSTDASYNLLENLLLWGRSQMGRLEPKPVTFRLSEICHETLTLLAPQVAEKKIELVEEVNGDQVIYADPEQMKIVLRNLLSNAIKFTPQQGKVEVRAYGNPDKKEIIVEVIDTGMGIPTHLREVIFQPDRFFTTEGTHREKGSGIGLSLSGEILQMNNGWITLESKPGKGSVFRFGVPAASGKA